MSDEFYDTKPVPMSSIAPLIRQAVSQGTEVRVRVKGNSMSPFLEDGRDTAVFTSFPKRPLRKGDIVLFQRLNGQYVMHRIYSIDSDGVMTFVGDGQISLEHGIKPEQLVAFVSKVIRKGHEIDCTRGAFRRFMIFYMYMHLHFSKLTCKAIDLAAKIKHLLIKG